MSTTVPTNGRGATSEATPEAPSPAATRNVHQRRLAVMARCKAVVPDKEHFQKFWYISIQALENHLREFLVAEGLDVWASFDPATPGFVTVTMACAETGECLPTYWPVVEGDKGWAYSVKYPLMRLFHVGDGEEGDEAEMAERSAHAADRQRSSSPSQPQRGAAGGTPPAAPAVARPSTVAGEIITLFNHLTADGRTKKDAWDILCSGPEGWKRGDGPPHAFVPKGSPEWQADLLARLRRLAGREDDETPEPVAAARGGGDVDPDEIPFAFPVSAEERRVIRETRWTAWL